MGFLGNQLRGVSMSDFPPLIFDTSKDIRLHSIDLEDRRWKLRIRAQHPGQVVEQVPKTAAAPGLICFEPLGRSFFVVEKME